MLILPNPKIDPVGNYRLRLPRSPSRISTAKTDFFRICDDKMQVYPSEIGLTVGDRQYNGELLYPRS